MTEGIYVLNMIDRPPLGFARAEVATLTEVFDHVALAAAPATLDRTGGGNLVAIASDAPIDLPAITADLAARGLGLGTDHRPRARRPGPMTHRC